ncbi:HlyD family secretion protein [Bdellovibrio sp. HCB290]|uniref:HlyD family secretion protein n=1 Tax=Bdellovibrio sp. HCB290 TaxID=3394356 RepID=UPI0039B5BFB4
MKLSEVIGTENRFLLGCWSVAVFLVLILGFVLSSDPVSILGVAESREFQVNFDSPVEIKHIYVLPSQIVHKGDLLAELGQSEWESQLRVLKSRYDKLNAEMHLRQQLAGVVKDLGHLARQADPLLVDLEDTRKEIALIEGRMKNLFVFAEVDGAVGAVNFKNGEQAPAFAPLITLVPLNPTYVNGYINENLSSTLAVGQMVEVSSTSGKVVRGSVVSIGSRIVQIPERLLRIQSLVAWGREVVIKIPRNNEFLLGEKVFVQKKWSLSFLNMAHADEARSGSDIPQQAPREMDIPLNIVETYKPEMSGVVFVPELKQFVLVSDDYPEDRPVLFLMNEQGQIQPHQIPVSGLSAMADIESVSVQGDNMYLLSSLSATKKGKLKEERQLFAQIKRTGLRYNVEHYVDLRKPLLQALKDSRDPVLKSIYDADLATTKEGFEVEGHTVDNKDLYLSLKGPVINRNEGLILKVSNFASVFEGTLKSDQVTLAARFEMKLPHQDVELVLTDLIRQGDKFYLASTCRGASCSAIWTVDAVSGRSELLHEFRMRHLEGLAIHPENHQMFAVFDSKSSSQYAVVSLAADKGTP